MNPITVAFFGISGSGKGTQADMLEKFLNREDPKRSVARAEMGALARAFMKTGTPLAKRTEEIVSSGGLLPSFIPIYLLVEVLKNFTGEEHLILDGTCRKPFQSMVADEIVNFYGRTDKHAIMLTLGKEAARARLVSRGRHDDATEAALLRRFAWFEQDVIPAYKTLEELGWAMHEINGEDDIESIHKTILSNLHVA